MAAEAENGKSGKHERLYSIEENMVPMGRRPAAGVTRHVASPSRSLREG
jgi:hypothetical protein